MNTQLCAEKAAELLCRGETLSIDGFVSLIRGREFVRSFLQKEAVARRKTVYGNVVYKRGLIECTSYCKNNCMYCGLRCSNTQAERYRLSSQTILDCCKNGYELGFRTFVLQGGEDVQYTPNFIADVVRAIKTQFHDCAVTLSFGEQSEDVYALWRTAGADRYLLRHETADDAHYQFLHAEEANPSRTAQFRRNCLFTLKNLGYQTGSGFMVASPHQTAELLAQDLCFLAELKPEMVGIGPFIPHRHTPFASYPAGTLELTTFLISVVRILLPHALIPSTTALGTIAENGRIQGILAGANVVMPNLSPSSVRTKYSIYENKICTGIEAAEQTVLLARSMESIGYQLTVSKGDYV